MKKTPLLIPLLAAVLFGPAAHAGVCSAAAAPDPPRFAVHHYLYDPAQKQRWAVVVDCQHPQWPAVLEPVDGTQPGIYPETYPQPDGMAATETRSAGSPSPKADRSISPWLLAGAKVRLWKDGQVRIQLSGTAVASAPPGAEVGVRVGAPGIVLHGIVRGPDSVELVEGGLTWRQ